MGAAQWAAVTAAMAAIPGVARMWSWQRVAGRRAREQARCDHVRHLPPGSRVTDRGRRGVVVEVGGRDDDGARR